MANDTNEKTPDRGPQETPARTTTLLRSSSISRSTPASAAGTRCATQSSSDCSASIASSRSAATTSRWLRRGACSAARLASAMARAIRGSMGSACSPNSAQRFRLILRGGGWTSLRARASDDAQSAIRRRCNSVEIAVLSMVVALLQSRVPHADRPQHDRPLRATDDRLRARLARHNRAGRGLGLGDGERTDATRARECAAHRARHRRASSCCERA